MGWKNQSSVYSWYNQYVYMCPNLSILQLTNPMPWSSSYSIKVGSYLFQGPPEFHRTFSSISSCVYSGHVGSAFNWGISPPPAHLFRNKRPLIYLTSTESSFLLQHFPVFYIMILQSVSKLIVIVLDPLRGSIPLEPFSNKMQSISGLPSSVHDSRLFKDRKILQSSTLNSPSTEIAEESTVVNYVAKASFDSGIAITLAALLCCVLCALSVSIVLRYKLRCRRRPVVSEPEIDVGDEGVKGDTGKKIDIKALPTTVYAIGSPLAGLDCPICLTEFVEGEEVRVLPECCHSFHVDCIDVWVVSNPSCPSCRHSLLYVVVEKSSGVVQPAAEPTQDAQMHGNESNQSVTENHVVQSSKSSVDDTTMVASSSLDGIRSNDLERCVVGEA